MKTLKEVLSEMTFLKLTPFAKKIGINPSSMRRYACGTRNPSPERDKYIRLKLIELGQELSKVRIHGSNHRKISDRTSRT